MTHAQAKFDAGPMIEKGVYHVTEDYALRHELEAQVKGAFFDGIERLEGLECRKAVERDGLRNIHRHFPVEKVDLLEDFIVKAIRDELYYWTYAVGSQNLQLAHPFYVDHLIVIRIHYPYAVARKGGETLKPAFDLKDRMRLAAAAASNPQILLNQLGRTLRKRQKIAEHKLAFNPVAYHGEIPTPARAHGPHIDTWYGHSYDGINLWLSIDGVNKDNTVILYPEMFGRDVDYDPASMYLAPGIPLPEPTKMVMKPGELLLFNPEILHGTQVNISDETRVALTTRLNPHTPRFNDDAPFNFEHWYSSEDLERRRFGVVKLFPAHKFEGEPSLQTDLPPIESKTRRIALDRAIEADQATVLCLSADLVAGEKLALDAPNLKLLLFRTKDGIKAFDRRCPHRLVDLADGHHDDKAIFCPGHGVAFSLETGASKCADFRLRERKVVERDGQIVLEAVRKAAASPALETAQS